MKSLFQLRLFVQRLRPVYKFVAYYPVNYIKTVNSFSTSVGHSALIHPLGVLRLEDRLICAGWELVVRDRVKGLEGLHTGVGGLSDDDSFGSHVRGGNWAWNAALVTDILNFKTYREFTCFFPFFAKTPIASSNTSIFINKL